VVVSDLDIGFRRENNIGCAWMYNETRMNCKYEKYQEFLDIRFNTRGVP